MVSRINQLTKALIENTKSLQALQSESFRSFMLGQGVSALGTGLQQVALSWYVYRITHSAWALAALSAMMIAGQVLLSFAGGCLADKYDRRKLLIVLQWLGAAIAVMLAALVFLKTVSLPLILFLSLLLGCFAALEYPVRQALNTELVTREHVLSARGLYSCICATSIAAGQALAGVLIDAVPAFGEAFCALLNGGSFVVSLLMLDRLKTWNELGKQGKSPANSPSPVLANANQVETDISSTKNTMNNRECISFALRSEIILMTFVQTIVLVLFGLRYMSLLPAFAAEVFHGGAKETGLLTATVALGFAIGGLVCGSLRQSERLEIWADLSLLLLPLALLAFCLSGQIHIALFSVLIMAVCQSVNINACICLLQLHAPDRLFGRLVGLRITVIAFCDLIAAALMIFLIQHFGMRATIMTASFICFAAAVLFFSRRALVAANTAGTFAMAKAATSNKKRVWP